MLQQGCCLGGVTHTYKYISVCESTLCVRICECTYIYMRSKASVCEWVGNRHPPPRQQITTMGPAAARKWCALSLSLALGLLLATISRGPVSEPRLGINHPPPTRSKRWHARYKSAGQTKILCYAVRAAESRRSLSTFIIYAARLSAHFIRFVCARYVKLRLKIAFFLQPLVLHKNEWVRWGFYCVPGRRKNYWCDAADLEIAFYLEFQHLVCKSHSVFIA